MFTKKNIKEVVAIILTLFLSVGVLLLLQVEKYQNYGNVVSIPELRNINR